jgi:hypothetical protein
MYGWRSVITGMIKGVEITFVPPKLKPNRRNVVIIH